MAQAQQRGQVPPNPPPTVNGIIPCSTGGGIGRISFDGSPITRATRMFANVAGRPVVDPTGLTGNWQFLLTFAPERSTNFPADANSPAADPDAPNFFTAIQEQLGLKLESTKAPFDITVIDSAEHPTED
jgi:uncharacterized protein (TIGR03435 family)